MVWTACPRESVQQMSEKQTKGREGRISQRETNDSVENAPLGGNVVSQDTETRPMSTNNTAKDAQISKHLQTKPLT